jgi:golgin subfamily B member 1
MQELSYSGSENPIFEEERGDQFTAPDEEREDADGERSGEDCSGNETSTTEKLQHDLNSVNIVSKICIEHPASLQEESDACINSETEIPAKDRYVVESLESIKRELYLIGLSRDLLQNKLDEQTASSTKLLSELMHCKSDLLDAINAKEKVELQLAHAVEEIDLCNMRCGKLETELDMSKERLEIAVSQLGALESENTSIKQENEKLKIMRESLSRENDELSTELLAEKERLVRLESNLKETGNCLERLVEENILISSSFNLQRSILVEDDESSTNSNLPNFPFPSRNKSSLNVRIEESKEILGNLKSSIESTRDRSAKLKKRGGISNLIKAYESQVTQAGTIVSDDVVSAEISQDPYDITVQFVGSLEKALNQMELDLMNTNDQYEGEKAGENLKKDYTAIKEKIDGLFVIFHTYQAKIDHLQEQFVSVQKGADDEAVRLLGKLEELQNEANDRLQKIQEERDGMVNAVSGAILRFNSSVGLSAMDKLTPDGIDMSTSLSSLVDFAVQSIETLRVENSMLQNRNEISSELIRKMYDKLQNAINYSEHGEVEIISNVEDLQLISNSYEGLMKHVQRLVDEDASLLTKKKELETALACKSKEAEELSVKCKSLSENLNDFCLIKGDLESILMGKNLMLEELYVRCLALANIMQDSEVADAASGDREKELLNSILPQLESSIASYLERHAQEHAQIDLSKKYLYEANVMTDIFPDEWALPLHLLLNSHLLPKLSEMRESMDLLNGSNIELQTDIQVLRDSLKEMEVSIRQSQLELNQKTTELELSEQRLSSVKEKLGIAVSKGKGLIVQRDSLKQSLLEKSSELERCMQRLTEAENKLKSYGEADRIEALESELSYIRDSYNVLRDSFLIKDSAIQRIEEVLEDLDFPEEFHARDIAEKVEVLSRMAVQSGNSSSMQGESSMQIELPQESSDAGSDEMKGRYCNF